MKITTFIIVIILILFIWAASILYASEKPKNNRKFNSFQLEVTRDQTIIYKYITMVRPGMPKILRKGIAYQIAKQSKQNNLPWELIVAIIKVESYFNPMVVSIVGAKGLMQIYTMECNNIIFDESKLYNIKYNIFCGICIFKDKLRIAKGDWYKAVTLYNGKGPMARQYCTKVKKTINEIIAFNNNFNNLRII